MDGTLARIQAQAAARQIRISAHAQQRMAAGRIRLTEVLEAIVTGQILEDYPVHRRGACCLLVGYTTAGRPLHVVCTSTTPLLVLITVYEPTPPKWITPTQRRNSS